MFKTQHLTYAWLWIDSSEPYSSKPLSEQFLSNFSLMEEREFVSIFIDNVYCIYDSMESLILF